MGSYSSIEWTDATWNPVTGCTKVSEGCRHCYAERLAPRLGQDFSEIILHPDRLDAPLHWRKPRRIFVNSLSDVFHEDIPESFIEQVFGVMASAKQHTFQVLTKRPSRMLEFMKEREIYGRQYTVVHEGVWPPPNVWLGVSVEDQQTADERIPLLMETPAAVRFVSYEPALGPLYLHNVPHPWRAKGADWVRLQVFAKNGIGPAGIKWIIVGGESGPKARPFDIAWARSVRDQCKNAGIACFVKQLGKIPTTLCAQCGKTIGKVLSGFVDACGPTHALLIKEMSSIADTKGGDWNEWPEDLRVREYPQP